MSIIYRLVIGIVFTAFTCSGQTISAFAGTGEGGFAGDGGLARLAMLNGPGPLAVDGAGGLYIIDGNNTRIRRVTSDGMITTFAGSGDVSSPVEGPANQSGFISLYDITVNPRGTLHIADADGMQKIDENANLRFLVTGQSVPNVTISNQGTIYLGNIGTVSRLEPDGTVTLLAGSATDGTETARPATQGDFHVAALTTDRLGNVFILDNDSNMVRMFAPGAPMRTVAGTGDYGFAGDGGPATQAMFSSPSGIAVDVAGNIYISDSSNQRIRKVTTDGMIETFAGQTDSEDPGDDVPALQAFLNYPANLAVSCTALYVTDFNRVRAISLNTPLIAQAGVSSLTTSLPTVRAGEMFSISGCNLAVTTVKADLGFSLPTTLGGATVTIGGSPVGIVSVSPTQIVAQLPAGIPAGTAALAVSVSLTGTATAMMDVN